MKKAKKILVTGAGGFIGCNLVAFLKKKGYWVRAAGTHFPEDRKQMWSKADEILHVDLKKIDNTSKAVHNCDWVFHLAADMGGVGYFTSHDYYPFINNMRMDLNMLEACENLKIKRLFYPSTVCIYPTHLQMIEGNAPKLSEDMIYPANSDLNYGWGKLMMLRLCEKAPFEARVGILNTVFGDYQETGGEKRKAPSALAMKAIDSLNTGTFEIWGNGKQIRSFCYITDAIEKIYRVMSHEKYEGPVNITSDEDLTIQQVAEMCCDIVGSKPKFIYNESQPSGVLSRSIDSSKFERIYKYKNKYSTRQGFEKLINFLQR